MTKIPNNGRIIQNIIQGCDTVMSHITHLYHLSALDFINTSSFPGMAPWLPSYTASDMLVATAANTATAGNSLVLHYVEALSMRRKMHTASALFSGRHPIQNAIVPGGVTTLLSSTYPIAAQTGTDYDLFGPFNFSETKTKFKTLLNEVRNFINLKYLPDIVTVATQYTAFGWNNGTGCGRFLAYGDYPVDGSGTLAIKRGITTIPGLTMLAFDQANIEEYVDYSYYNYGVLDPKSLHPFDGKTTPNMGTTNGYSWLKAPRYSGQPCEVGPLARVVVSYAAGSYPQVSQAGTDVSPFAALGTEYGINNMVAWALSSAAPSAAALDSVLGRHAARALEAKFLADAMAGTSGTVTAWVDQLVADQPCYTYTRIPKQICTGYGLCEAPRGALGHWIKIEGRKVAKYQCVVPSTWNFSPRISPATADHGAVEQSLIGSNIGTTTTEQVVNILRIVHPFDCCIACAVHVLNPEGKETLRFAIGPDGRPTNIKKSE